MVEVSDNIILVEAFLPIGETTPKLEFSYADDKTRKVEDICTTQVCFTCKLIIIHIHLAILETLFI